MQNTKTYNIYDPKGVLVTSQQGGSAGIVGRQFMARSTIKSDSICYVKEKNYDVTRIYGFVKKSIELEEPYEMEIYDNLTGMSKKIVYKYRSRIDDVEVPNDIYELINKKI